MYLYQFKVVDQQNEETIYFKFCTHIKKTTIYKNCISLLDRKKIKHFEYEKL